MPKKFAKQKTHAKVAKEEKKSEDAAPIPTVDLNKPLAIESEVTSPIKEDVAVPTVEPDATLKIEQVIEGHGVPEVDRNAPLAIESQEEVTEEASFQKSNKKLYFAGVVGLLAVFASVFGFFIFSNKLMFGEQKVVVPVEVKVDSSPKLEEKQAVVKTEWTFEVLNGSGVTGAAGAAADKLEKAGYKVVKAGNADKSNYIKSEIYIAKTFKDKETLLLSDMGDLFGVATSSGDLNDSTVSARLILGKN